MNAAPDLVVPRTVTSTHRGDDGRTSRRSNPLVDWRSADAYVLLGEPGSGKTTAFQAEALALGDDGMYITARDFLIRRLTEIERRKVIFIDALDEKLIGSVDPTAPFDSIRMRISEIQHARFRISCREADWLAEGAKALQSVVPGVTVAQLSLDPLSDSQVIEILESFGPDRVSDPQSFVGEARHRGVDHLLRNPLLVDLLVRAVRGNRWPKTREETYRLACEHLAQEQNPEHRRRLPTRPTTAELLTVAGRLCAALLLSDQATISMEAEGSGDGAVSIDIVASELSVRQDTLLHCLNSKLFVAEGVYRSSRHRTIAEFLGAKALAELAVTHGVPLPRLLALMLGYDGRVVEPLRGLYAWLTVHDQRDRQLLLENDPLALVLYGDVKGFSVVEKTRILDALQREAERYSWFRSDLSTEQPFGNLGTADMTEVFRGWLLDPARDAAHQLTLACVLDAIHHGHEFPDLLGHLESIVRDGSYRSRIRAAALDAWMAKPGFDAGRAVTLLEDVRIGSVLDLDDQIAGHLLFKLYPTHLDPATALRLLRPRKDSSFIGEFHMFWALWFLQSTPVQWRADVADLMVKRAKRKEILDDEDSSEPMYDQFRELLVEVVAKAIETFGDIVTVDRLYAWLDACLGKYRLLQQSKEIEQIRAWLEFRVEKMASLYRTAISQVEPGPDGVRRFGAVRLVLMHAKLPSDWHHRLLAFAREADSTDEAAHYVKEAAEAAVEPDKRFNISLDDIDRWVDVNAARWPEARSWVESATTWPLDSYHAQEYKYRQNSHAKRLRERSKRQREIAPQLSKISTVAANPSLLYNVAHAYWAEKNSQFKGSTATERIADLLAAGPAEAADALNGVLISLEREDIPSVKEIFDLAKERRFYYLSYVCQLGAQLRFSVEPSAIIGLPGETLQKLIAFHVLQGAPGDRAWFKAVCRERPQDVANVLLPFLEEQIRTEEHPNFDAVYDFRRPDGPLALSQICVPRLLKAFPYETSDPIKLHLLDSVIIRGGLLSLQPSIFHALITSQLATAASIAARMSLHMALIAFDGQRHCDALEALCTDLSAVQRLATVIDEQACIDDAFVSANAAIVSRLSRIIMRSTERADWSRPREYGSVSETAESLIRRLAQVPSIEVGTLLSDMRQEEGSATWRPFLDWQIFEQSKLVRAARFSAPSFVAVCAVVANGSPANHRDLAELLRDHLVHLAQRIQYHEANLLETFYRGSKEGVVPKVENDCRDILLGLIEDRISQQGAAFDKEAHTARDKRADLRGSLVRSTRMAIPIEVKKDNHPDVWTAWRDQLHARYTAHPQAGGIGIYLVLWFGVKTTRAPCGGKPRTAEEMSRMLDALISSEFRQTTFGLVIDLSKSIRRSGTILPRR
ncbi:NACHT domain-containing protein [Variovorax guangxiensis]|uniref:Uncharacterized protein n=1 Tax=Variovorax guangxiensis TaxID=1775474 RepID=A0A840FWR0_9BURK|nr:hypothetical protein [Variovorax guangxiensis]MBB4225192.1 hypothetical protein [Variovorax guangxiensis]